MIKNEKARIWVNRFFSLIIGGLAVFLVMNALVVNDVKKQNEELKKELFEASGLLDDAKAYYEDANYKRTKATLDTLFEEHPGSTEATAGRALYAEMESVIQKQLELQNALDEKWDGAVEAIRAEWAVTMATKLRTEFEQNRDQLEKDMNNILNKEWEKMKGQIREEWEKQK
jgi:hypothetical protein